MQEVVDKLYTVLLNIEDPKFMSALMNLAGKYTGKWDKPKELPDFVLGNWKPAKKSPAKKLPRGST